MLIFVELVVGITLPLHVLKGLPKKWSVEPPPML